MCSSVLPTGRPSPPQRVDPKYFRVGLGLAGEIQLSESGRRLPAAAVRHGSLRVRTTLGRPGRADAEPSESVATGDGADRDQNWQS